MKSSFPQDQPLGTVSDAQRADFWNSWFKTVLWAFGVAVVIDLVYFFVISGAGIPAKPGWLTWLAANLVFSACMAAIAVNIWRHYGGTPPLFDRYGPGKKRSILNGLVLGLLLFGVVVGAVFVLFFACSGGFMVGAESILREVLFAQTEETAYVGVKVIGVAVGMELGGKVEDQPPR